MSEATIAKRIEPTPEDFAIYQRHLRRVLRECEASGLHGISTVEIVRRWTFDYIGIPHVQEPAL